MASFLKELEKADRKAKSQEKLLEETERLVEKLKGLPDKELFRLAMKRMGSRTSPLKKLTSAVNGMKGGRPRLSGMEGDRKRWVKVEELGGSHEE